MIATGMLAITLSAQPGLTQDPVGTESNGESETTAVDQPAAMPNPLDAPRLVEQGNEKLIAGDPAAALQFYRDARNALPDAPELDFVEGLAEYKLGNLPEARTLFEKATIAPDDQLVDDAIYSVGTTYHREALAEDADPKTRIAALEEAMRRYRSVLKHQPDHAAARDANAKAASMWRAMKQQQQQQQQQQQNQDQENEDNEDEQQDQQQNQQQDEQEQNQQQDQQQQEQQNQDQQQDQQQQDQEQQEQEQQSQQEQQEQQQQQQEQQAKEERSREQAERQLRELMQALRDRLKKQREKEVPVRVVPAEKDW
ncbi:MAG: hypothetical protein ACPGXK_13320 [Phycisphaerae bacterium]